MSVQQTAARGHSKVSARKVADREALFTITLSFSSRGSNSFVGLGFFNMFGGVRVEFADVQPMFVCVCACIISVQPVQRICFCLFFQAVPVSHTHHQYCSIYLYAHVFSKKH